MQPSLVNISFTNFRSYKKFVLKDIAPITIFVGENGVGKTNILEGINILTTGKSFRNGQLKDIILFNEKYASLSSKIETGNRLFDVDIVIEKENTDIDIDFDIPYGDSEDAFEKENNSYKKKITINDKKRKQQYLTDILPSVVFSPDDVLIVKGGKTIRREIIDNIGSLLSKQYRRALYDYKKIVVYKNKLLKDEFIDENLLESINEMLIDVGSLLFLYRYKLVKNIESKIVDVYKEISNNKEQVSIFYNSDFYKIEDGDLENREDVKKAFQKNLLDKKKEEIARKRSLIGPQSDEINFYLDGKDARIFASQGQQRSIALSLKIVEVKLIKEIFDILPVLLLDDVGSELDMLRKASLLGIIENNMQTFITTTDLGNLPENIINKARIYETRDFYE